MSNFGALVVHGLFEHKGRHEDNVAWLEKLGIEAHSFNLPGHGDVDEKGHIESWDENIESISKAYEEIEAKEKKIIFAHSYGSLAIIGIIFSLTLLLVLLNGGSPKTGEVADYMQLIITVFSGPVFYTYFWLANDGQTLGMQAWKIKLISEEKLSVRICLLRCAFSTFSFLFAEAIYRYH